MRVVILYDPGAEDWTPEDIRGVMKAVDEIGTIFGAMGHEIRKVAVRHDMRWFAVARRADVVFNLCEGVHGRGEWEEHVVGTLEFAGIPVTGASLWTIAACRRKPIANALLAHAGHREPRVGQQRRGRSRTTSPSRRSSNPRRKTRARGSTAARWSRTAARCAPAWPR